MHATRSGRNMTSPGTIENITVRLATSEAEIRAAQKLRYKVFYEEYAATPTEQMAAEKRDFDPYDDVADHLIVVDEGIRDPQQQIVGTYRLLRREAAAKAGGFYSSAEYDITPIIDSKMKVLELGRSCVMAEYRTRPVLQLLWQGITDYMLDHNIGIMFGCASLYGTDTAALSQQLAYLYHYHLAPEELRTHAIAGRHIDMNMHTKESIDAKAAFSALPALIKGYLRLGAYIGDGAVIDHQFNTVDVCIILPMKEVAERYRKFYSRKVNRYIPAQGEIAVSEEEKTTTALSIESVA